MSTIILNQGIITGKGVTVWIVTGVAPTLVITEGVPVLSCPAYTDTGGVLSLSGSGGSPAAFSTLGRIKFDNRAEHSAQQASNLRGGVARPPGTRMLKGYLWGYGQFPPLFPNDLFGVNFTLDGTIASPVCATNPCLRCTAVEVVVEPYSEEKRNKCYYICHFAGAGFDFAAFELSGTAPNRDPADDNTQPQEFPTKSLGLGVGPKGSISGGGGTPPTMAWTGGSAGQVVPFVDSMRLKIMALASQAWPSNVNGIAFTPAGDIDWTLTLRQCTNAWSVPTDPVLGDLDGNQCLLMATQLNDDLSFKTGVALEYGDLTEKRIEAVHDPSIMVAEYVFEKNILQQDGSTYYGSITGPDGITRWGTVGS